MIVICPAVPVFSSPSSFDFPPRRDSSNVAFYSPLHRSSPPPPPPGCSSSLTFSASLSNLTFFLLTRAGHHRMKHNRRVVVVKAISFPVDSNEEGDGDGYGESEGKRSGGGRNATQETARFARANFQGLEEPGARARVTWPSQDQARVSWSPQKQQDRASWSSKKHQTRDSWSSDNKHTAFGPSRNQHRDSFSSQNQHRASFSSQKQSRISWSPEEHQTRVYRPPVKQDEGSFSSQKQPRVSSFSQYEPLRFHKKFSVFESVAEPDTFRRSSNNSADPPFFSAEEADASSKFNRQKPSYSRGLQSSFQNFQQEGSLGEGNPKKGSMFTSKLEEILSNFKKKDSFSKRSCFIDGLNDEGTRDDDAPLPLRNRSHTIRGLQGTISEGYTAQAIDVSTPLRKDMQGARNTDFSLQTSVQDVNGKDVRENMQSHYEEGRFSPRSHAEDMQSGLGEGSFSANGKENAGGDHEAKTAPFNLFASSPPVPWEADRRYSSASKPCIPIGKGNAKVSVQRISTSIGSRSSPSRSSVLGRNSKYSKLDPQAGRGITSALKLNGRAKQTEPRFKNKEGTEMCGLPELKEDEGTIQIKSRAQKSVESTESVNFDCIDSDTEDDAKNVLSVPSDAEDDAATSCKSGTRSWHSKKSYQPALGTYSNHISSAISCVGVNTGASASSDGGDSSKTSSWHNHTLPGLPFEFQYSYSETPKAPILHYQETPYYPFGPTTKERPWTGRAPLKQSKKKLPGFDSFNPPPRGKKGIKLVQDSGPYPEGQGPKPLKSREEILGEPLTKEEIVYLVEKCQRESRQLNLGRDGLTHNMLDVIHCYWKRRRVCRVKCKGVPTVDMDNVCFHIEDKTGGKIIYKTGGVLYLFRGRNYNYKDHPKIPLMLWKPATPLYPKLIQQAPKGLTKEEADRLRLLGRKVKPICRLGKNGVYLTLVGDVRNAFKVDDLVRIDCRGLNLSDYKKIGAKLSDLVPCVLLSFDKEHILMWKGKAKASADVDTKPSDEGVNLTETSTSCNLGCSGLSIIENETKNLVDDASSHATENVANEDFKQQSLVGDKIGWDKADLMPERTMAESKHDAAVDFTRGQESKSNAGLDSSSEAPSRSVKSNLVEEQYLDEEQYLVEEQYLDEEMEGEDTDSINSLLEEGRADHVVVRVEEQYLDEEMEGQDSNSINSLLKESRANHVVVHVDALWNHAIASGMAIELDEADMDCDLVVRKAGELAQVAPIAPVYTQSLLSKLKI